jgi:hypothetical protein
VVRTAAERICGCDDGDDDIWALRAGMGRSNWPATQLWWGCRWIRNNRLRFGDCTAPSVGATAEDFVPARARRNHARCRTPQSWHCRSALLSAIRRVFFYRREEERRNEREERRDGNRIEEEPRNGSYGDCERCESMRAGWAGIGPKGSDW